MSKELNIATIKKELMDALLNNVQIIDSFPSDENIKKVTDYIGKNIFNYLDDDVLNTITSAFVNFDVSQNKGSYHVYIVAKIHKDSLSKTNGENKLDILANAITDVVNELYSYHKAFLNQPRVRDDRYAERQICFTLYKGDKEKYECENVMLKKEEPEKGLTEIVTELRNDVYDIKATINGIIFCNSQK